MESQEECFVIDDLNRAGDAVSGLYGETCDSFDSELHLVSVDNMLSLGKWNQFSSDLGLSVVFVIMALFSILVTIIHFEGTMEITSV